MARRDAQEVLDNTLCSDPPGGRLAARYLWIFLGCCDSTRRSKFRAVPPTIAKSKRVSLCNRAEWSAARARY